MTFMLLLGAAAGLYLIWLLFRLAAIALPCAAAVVVALQLHDRGFGHGIAIGAAFMAGLLLLLAGRHLYASGGSIVMRLLVALAFIIPAGIAGYHAMAGVANITSAATGASVLFSLAGALVASVAALKSLGAGPTVPEGDTSVPTRQAPDISPF